MKTAILFAATLVCAAASFAENYYIATVTDFVGEKSMQVVGKEAAKELDADIRRKNALLQKVLAELQNEFKKNPEMHAGEKFYGAKLKPMTIQLSQPFPDEEKAQDKLTKIQEREDEKAMAETGKKKKKLSDSEKERAFKEAEREYAVKAFGEEVVRLIEEKLGAAGGAK
ncbi:MAG: hypothetical protein IJP66_01090 [Kiritimatiellae bacterium]|nr:hypothetical protein [Kiritimatiellia bacterium]